MTASPLLEAHCGQIPDGPVLFLGAAMVADILELVRRGRAVTVFEESGEALRRLAGACAAFAPRLTLHRADADSWRLGYERWSAILVLFSEWPTRQRRRLFAQIPTALRAGGVFLMEAQAFDAGAPRHPDYAGLDPEDVRPELEVLHFSRFATVSGTGSVTPAPVLQVVGIHGEPEGLPA